MNLGRVKLEGSRLKEFKIKREYEDKLFEKYNLLCGIDEVGRGCLFGDVVSAAVILPKDSNILGINDSKKLTEKKREKLYIEILNEAIAVGIGRVEVEIIDKINIKNAAKLSMLKAINNLRDRENKIIRPDYLLVDAEHLEIDIPQLDIVKGDENSYTIAAASIVAKVYRDNLCKKWDELYPNYGIKKHKGYATKYHREALKSYGPSEMHRKSFLNNLEKW